MKIAIAGTGYVGLSDAMLLAQHNEVVAHDIVDEKVKLLNNRHSPIADDEIEEFLQAPSLNFTATTNKEMAYARADFVVIATPTDYDPETNYVNTESIEYVIADILNINPNTTMVIRIVAEIPPKNALTKDNCSATATMYLGFNSDIG